MGRGLYLPCVAICLFFTVLQAEEKIPEVQVYSRHPVEVGKENILNCYVEKFHPPKIEIDLLKDNVLLTNVKKSDLTFNKDWTFQILASATVVPDGHSKYTCKVVHSSLKEPKIVKWDHEY